MSVFKILMTALAFGLISLMTILGQLTIPIPGTNAVTDPREIFTTIGSALSGPLGALIISVLAAIAVPGGVPLASLLGHLSGCLWMALAYKHLVRQFIHGNWLFLAWPGLIVVYYYAFLAPGFILGLIFFYHQPISFLETYASVASGALVEVITTIILTTTLLAVLPRKYLRPMW